ncbi:peptidoglycan DD-metalloendopeptidase family protein [Ferrovibrio xuzhouensis]|uniref:Peptidoglycan DD-metalloendopeptidase family protein n=1 Tax=Ferrovibrio xuzhouensis TaxID=1576914 RepID=A0ABV7VJP0_9PROT
MLALLTVAACGTQPPAPVEFGHSLNVPRAVEPGPNPAASQIAVAPGTTPEAVTVQAGDTVYALSRRYHRPVRAIIDDNNLQPPYQLQPGQRIEMPGGQFHTVQRGDTLYSISRAYGVDLYSIARTNDLAPPYAIAVGQQLRISAPGGSAIASAPHDAAPATGPAATGTVGSLGNGGVQVEALPPPGGTAATPPAVTPSVAAPPGPKTPAAPGVLMPPPPGGTAAAKAPEPPAAEAKPEGQAATAEPAPEDKPVIPEEKPTPPAAQQPAETQQAAVVPPRSGRTFSWPVRGRIISSFGPKADGLHNDGINIAARAGAPVTAAENGVVVYAGNELRGFGNLLLVRHAGGWITAYAHLDRMLVKKGQQVARGQAIGTVGSSGGVSSPQLHFEIRQGTQAVDPAKFLAVT